MALPGAAQVEAHLVLEPVAAEPWQTEPVAETPESVLDPYGASGAPTIDLSPVPVQRPLHVGYRLPDPSVLKRSQEARVEQAALDRMVREIAAVNKVSEPETQKIIETQLAKSPKRTKATAAEADQDLEDEQDEAA